MYEYVVFERNVVKHFNCLLGQYFMNKTYNNTYINCIIE